MKYFVSYFVTKNNGEQGWGNCIICRDEAVWGVSQVRAMEQLIEKNNDGKRATIMYWRRLEDAE